MFLAIMWYHQSKTDQFQRHHLYFNWAKISKKDAGKSTCSWRKVGERWF